MARRQTTKEVRRLSSRSYLRSLIKRARKLASEIKDEKTRGKAFRFLESVTRGLMRRQSRYQRWQWGVGLERLIGRLEGAIIYQKAKERGRGND